MSESDTNCEKLAKDIGTLVKNLPDLHEREFKQGLTIDQNTVLQKFVSEDLLTVKVQVKHSDGAVLPHTGIRVESENYLKAMVFLQYFTNVLEEDTGICSNLIELAIRIREQDSAKAEEYSKSSSLSLSSVVIEAGLYSKQRIAQGTNETTPEKIIKRYKTKNMYVLEGAVRRSDPYYQEIGRRFIDMVDPKRRKYFEKINSRLDIQATIFTDCVLSVIDDNSIKKIIEEQLSEDKVRASMTALYALRNYANIEKLKQSLMEVD